MSDPEEEQEDQLVGSSGGTNSIVEPIPFDKSLIQKELKRP